MTNIKDMLKALKTDSFVLNCRIPMGYTAGIPVLSIRNGYLCLTVPYLRYKLTGVVDKTLVYPIRNTITISIPDGEVVGFEDLRFNPKFEKVNFTSPIGFFRPDKLKELNKQEYDERKTELLALYDKLIAALVEGGEYTEEDEARMTELLKLLIEPYLYPIYKALDADFYNKYLI